MDWIGNYFLKNSLIFTITVRILIYIYLTGNSAYASEANQT